MGRIWAVARQTISEGIRMKIALVFIAVAVLLIGVLPFSIQGDGVTIKSRIQSFLAYSLGLITFLLSMLTVFLSCATLSNEIRLKQIFMITSKPIPRWQVVMGKWAGICTLNTALLLLTWLGVWGATLYLSRLETTVPGDDKAVQEEILTVRHAMKPEPPDFDALTEQRVRALQEEGRLDDVPPSEMPQVRSTLYNELQFAYKRYEPREVRDLVFRGLIIDREAEGWVLLQIKPEAPSGVDDVEFTLGVLAGDPNERETLQGLNVADYIADRVHLIPIPNSAINSNGDLFVRLANLSEREPVAFEDDGSLELLYNAATFHWNVFRALSLLWCQLAFLATVGLAASTFLSFPVACMGCLLVLATASMGGFLEDAVGWVSPSDYEGDMLGIFGPVIRPAAHAFVWMVPDFSKYNPIGNVVGGRVVTLKWVVQGLIVLVGIKGLVLAGLGCLVFTKRELGQMTA